MITKMTDHFNLWATICTSAERITLPSKKPNWFQLTATVQLLSKISRRRLILKYHPDKLSSVLGTTPNDAEVKMSNLAMSALNLLFSENYQMQQKSIMATMWQLEELYRENKKPKPKEPKEPKEPKQPKEPKEPKQPKEPKRKPTAYNNFVRITSPQLKVENKKGARGDMMKMLGEMWKNLSAEEKNAFL